MLSLVLRGLLISCLLVAATAEKAVADLDPGYTLGAGSQLLTANGGAGAVLFSDTAALGGTDVNASGTATFNSVLLNGDSFWSAGDTVSITGVAFTLIGGTDSQVAKTGTFTFDIREGSGGTGASGAGSLSSLGTRTASYTQPAGSVVAQVVYANFDTPLTFVADANSTTIGIHFSTPGSIRYKSTTSTSGLARYNFGNGNLVGNYQLFSVAGSVAAIPEPSSLLFFGIATVGVAVRMTWRRRRALRRDF